MESKAALRVRVAVLQEELDSLREKYIQALTTACVCRRGVAGVQATPPPATASVGVQTTGVEAASVPPLEPHLADPPRVLRRAGALTAPLQSFQVPAALFPSQAEAVAPSPATLIPPRRQPPSPAVVSQDPPQSPRTPGGRAPTQTVSQASPDVIQGRRPKPSPGSARWQQIALQLKPVAANLDALSPPQGDDPPPSRPPLLPVASGRPQGSRCRAAAPTGEPRPHNYTSRLKCKRRAKGSGKPCKRVRGEVQEEPPPPPTAGSGGDGEVDAVGAAANAPHYKYREVVRGKEARARLRGFECKDCVAFHAIMAREGVTDLKHMCSRHRAQFTPPATPAGYWDLSMPDDVV